MKVFHLTAGLVLLLLAPAGVHSQHVLEFVIPPCPHVGTYDPGGHDPGALLFPNPVVGCLTLHLTGTDGVLENGVTLVDLQGRTVLEMAVEGSSREMRLDLSGVVPGVYILRFNTGGRRHQQKIVVGNS